MKVVILSGGFGTRISEYTSLIPKPMIRIGDKPIIEHIMEIYSKSGFNEFYLALGYKSEVIKKTHGTKFFSYLLLSKLYLPYNGKIFKIIYSTNHPYTIK